MRSEAGRADRAAPRRCAVEFLSRQTWQRGRALCLSVQSGVHTKEKENFAQKITIFDAAACMSNADRSHNNKQTHEHPVNSCTAVLIGLFGHGWMREMLWHIGCNFCRFRLGLRLCGLSNGRPPLLLSCLHALCWIVCCSACCVVAASQCGGIRAVRVVRTGLAVRCRLRRSSAHRPVSGCWPHTADATQSAHVGRCEGAADGWMSDGLTDRSPTTVAVSLSAAAADQPTSPPHSSHTPLQQPSAAVSAAVQSALPSLARPLSVLSSRCRTCTSPLRAPLRTAVAAASPSSSRPPRAQQHSHEQNIAIPCSNRV